jgi:hypothetical protein
VRSRDAITVRKGTMSDPDNQQVLGEIRDLLKEQNRLIADIKAQNDAVAARTGEHMKNAEALARNQLAQNERALGSTAWLKWGFWVFLALLLLFYAGPVLWQVFSGPSV